MGPGGPGSGGYGPPPGGGSSNTALWVILGVLVVAAVGGLLFFLTQDDDDEGGGAATGGTTPGTEPGSPPTPPDDITIPSIPDGGGGGGGGGGGDVVSQTADWIYANSPGGVDMDESTCMAELVVDVVGEDVVGDAGGDLQEVYSGTSLDEDEQISAGIGDCIDSASLEEWRSEGMPW